MPWIKNKTTYIPSNPSLNIQNWDSRSFTFHIDDAYLPTRQHTVTPKIVQRTVLCAFLHNHLLNMLGIYELQAASLKVSYHPFADEYI